MIGAAFLFVALLVGAACAGLAWSHARRVHGVMLADAGELERALKRVPEERRVAELLERSRPGSFEHELAAEVLAAPDAAAKLVAVNEALADVEHTLTARAGWPRAAIRIALLAAGLLGAVAYLIDRDQIKWPLAIVLTGGVAALLSVEAGRSAERGAAAQRQAIDRLVAATVGSLEKDRADEAPERRSKRRGSRT